MLISNKNNKSVIAVLLLSQMLFGGFVKATEESLCEICFDDIPESNLVSMPCCDATKKVCPDCLSSVKRQHGNGSFPCPFCREKLVYNGGRDLKVEAAQASYAPAPVQTSSSRPQAEAEVSCQICYDDVSPRDLVSLPCCGHHQSMCKDCLGSLKKKHGNGVFPCPYCRGKLVYNGGKDVKTAQENTDALLAAQLQAMENQKEVAPQNTQASQPVVQYSRPSSYNSDSIFAEQAQAEEYLRPQQSTQYYYSQPSRPAPRVKPVIQRPVSYVSHQRPQYDYVRPEKKRKKIKLDTGNSSGVAAGLALGAVALAAGAISWFTCCGKDEKEEKGGLAPQPTKR